MAKIHVGISGWRYPPWRGEFYPKGLRQADELAFASRLMPSIEINGSFYGLQRPESYAKWYEATPPGFVFAHKGNREVTHIRRLHDVEAAVARIFASGVFLLREKLGPFLWQLPPSLPYEAERIEQFLRLLPRDTEQASALVRRHAPGGRIPESDMVEHRVLRHALEIRHHSFEQAAFIRQLRRYRVALVVADSAGKWPTLEDVTADFMYLRLHGEKVLYSGAYSKEALNHWAERMRVWHSGSQPDDARLMAPGQTEVASGRDIYCYFDNTDKLNAPFDAQRLMKTLGLAYCPVGSSLF